MNDKNFLLIQSLSQQISQLQTLVVNSLYANYHILVALLKQLYSQEQIEKIIKLAEQVDQFAAKKDLDQIKALGENNKDLINGVNLYQISLLYQDMLQSLNIQVKNPFQSKKTKIIDFQRPQA